MGAAEPNGQEVVAGQAVGFPNLQKKPSGHLTLHLVASCAPESEVVPSIGQGVGAIEPATQ